MNETCDNCYNYYRANSRTLQMFDHCIEAEYAPVPEEIEKIFDSNNKGQTCNLWQEKK